MAREVCPNCGARMSRPVGFCPGCARPTPHATSEELLEWDLGQWRNHVERSVASGGATASKVAVRLVRTVPRRPAPDLQVIVRPDAPPSQRARRGRSGAEIDASTPSPATPKRRRRTLLTGVRRLRGRHARRPEPATQDRVIVLDADSAFVYTACTSCERGDWIVRTTRNEDETYNYWCCRCSRSFKSDARIRRAWKPFLASGSVIGALAALSVVMR